jgi:hypothetical protein
MDYKSRHPTFWQLERGDRSGQIVQEGEGIDLHQFAKRGLGRQCNCGRGCGGIHKGVVDIHPDLAIPSFDDDWNLDVPDRGIFLGLDAAQIQEIFEAAQHFRRGTGRHHRDSVVADMPEQRQGEVAVQGGVEVIVAVMTDAAIAGLRAVAIRQQTFRNSEDVIEGLAYAPGIASTARQQVIEVKLCPSVPM